MADSRRTSSSPAAKPVARPGHYAELADIASIAATVAHPAGDDLRYLTGVVTEVDGGFTA